MIRERAARRAALVGPAVQVGLAALLGLEEPEELAGAAAADAEDSAAQPKRTVRSAPKIT